MVVVVGDGWVKCYWAGGLSSVRGWKEAVGWVTCYLVKVRCWWRSGPHAVARAMMEGGCGLGHMLPRRQDVMGEKWWRR